VVAYRTDGSWLPVDDVRTQVGATEDTPQAAQAERARLAAAAYVERVRPDLLSVVITAEQPDGVVTFDASPDVIEGAVLYAARLYARKGSPSGLASFGEFGPAALPRLDADIERLLGVGRYGKPVAR
jgi:hypothetical protein